MLCDLVRLCTDYNYMELTFGGFSSQRGWEVNLDKGGRAFTDHGPFKMEAEHDVGHSFDPL